jgi:hypothetical protein
VTPQFGVLFPESRLALGCGKTISNFGASP